MAAVRVYLLSLVYCVRFVFKLKVLLEGQALTDTVHLRALGIRV
jgi:hypothetical protein